MINSNNFPKWIRNLESADLKFIREFILCSGSLKELAKIYEVSYPTVRLRLDRLINKIETNEEKDDAYITMIKNLALEEKIDYEVAKTLIEEYRKGKEE